MPLTGPIPNVYTVIGQVTNPSAGGTIASVTVSPGVYALAFGGYLSVSTGSYTTSASDADNMSLQCDPVTSGQFVTQQVLLLPPSVSVPITLYHIPVYAISTIKIIAVGNASASTVIYHASIATSWPGPSGHLI